VALFKIKLKGSYNITKFMWLCIKFYLWITIPINLCLNMLKFTSAYRFRLKVRRTKINLKLNFRKRVSLELWQPRTLANQQAQINKQSKCRCSQASSPTHPNPSQP